MAASDGGDFAAMQHAGLQVCVSIGSNHASSWDKLRQARWRQGARLRLSAASVAAGRDLF